MALIRDNLISLRERIARASLKARRNPGAVTLVAVAKTRTPEEIREALEAGVTDIGENKVQESLLKYNALITHNSQPITIKWHLVGHLQTNKAKDAVGIFDLIHSVDSLRLAEEINKQAGRIGKIQDILVEVNTSGETSKFGVRPQETGALITEIAGLANIRLQGLMTMAPALSSPEEARPYFRMLRELKDKINQTTGGRLTRLSMGMSDDFEVAIEEGADIIRLGRAIFGG